jgi:hypothetical protein
MFTPINYIETIQTTKKSIVEKVILDNDLNKLAKSYIDAETEFTKNVFQASMDLATYFADSLVNFKSPTTAKAK